MLVPNYRYRGPIFNMICNAAMEDLTEDPLYIYEKMNIDDAPSLRLLYQFQPFLSPCMPL